MKVVIMAGGKGTRVASVSSDVPKPMLLIEGKPVLEYEIESLRIQGFCDLIITVGHLAHVIMDYFGDGEKFGVKITYYIEKEPLGNGGALFRLRRELQEDFLLLIGDAMFDIDFHRFVNFHREHGAYATLFTHPNSHPYDSGLIITDKKHVVMRWLTKEDARPIYYKNRVNAGIHMVAPKVIDLIAVSLFGEKLWQQAEKEGYDSLPTVKVDLDRQLLRPLCGSGKMFAYDSPEYVKDMGTPERFESVAYDFREGIVCARNLSCRQKAIFLDRDGTINEHVGFLTDEGQFKLLPKVADAIRQINQSGYLAIVITNQPVIARGEVSFEQLEQIHNKMETLLGMEGAYLDAIYFCPHHPDAGYEGEISNLKKVCECRKPAPGMILKAAKEYNIDLEKSWMIGDNKIDIQCGKNALCKTALIDGDGTGRDFGQDITGINLYEIINCINNGMM